MEENKQTGLKLMRVPFKAEEISKLPKPSKAQTAASTGANWKGATQCSICGGRHHPKAVHLDYVGHAALTNRLLECDESWGWEPLATTEQGLPLFDNDGGLWIELTICGVTRKGYGSADGKRGGNAVKEVIGDALRNAAMRFGAALDLWNKGKAPLYDANDEQPQQQQQLEQQPDDVYSYILDNIKLCRSVDQLILFYKEHDKVIEFDCNQKQYDDIIFHFTEKQNELKGLGQGNQS